MVEISEGCGIYPYVLFFVQFVTFVYLARRRIVEGVTATIEVHHVCYFCCSNLGA